MRLTTGQYVVLRALEAGHGSVGVSPGALGRIVASLYDRRFVKTTAMSIHSTSRFGDLRGWTITEAGRAAFNAEFERKQGSR